MDNVGESTDRSITAKRRLSTTEARILDAAEFVFARRGLPRTRVREAAEVDGATLYNDHASKRALCEAVLERGIPPVSVIHAGFAKTSNDAESAHRTMRAAKQPSQAVQL